MSRSASLSCLAFPVIVAWRCGAGVFSHVYRRSRAAEGAGQRIAETRTYSREADRFQTAAWLDPAALEQAFSDGRREEVGGLSGEGGYPSSAPARAFLRTNTDEMTLEEIGQEFDVTRERIRQIEAKALRQLRSPERARHLRALLAAR